MDRLELLRRAAAVRMGLAPDPDAAARVVSIPKVGILSAPVDTAVLSGATLAADEVDIVARMISVGQPHRAVPLTGALCLAVACRVPGGVAHELVRRDDSGGDPAAPVRIGHPSGSILVAAEVVPGDDGYRVPFATVFRTARRPFRGEVFTPRPDPDREATQTLCARFREEAAPLADGGAALRARCQG